MQFVAHLESPIGPTMEDCGRQEMKKELSSPANRTAFSKFGFSSKNPAWKSPIRDLFCRVTGLRKKRAMSALLTTRHGLRGLTLSSALSLTLVPGVSATRILSISQAHLSEKVKFPEKCIVDSADFETDLRFFNQFWWKFSAHTWKSEKNGQKLGKTFREGTVLPLAVVQGLL